MINPYFHLRGWPEFVGFLILGIIVQFLDTLSIPQLVGPELRQPVVVYNLLPLVMTASVLVLLGSRWNPHYEAATIARSVMLTRIAIVGVIIATWAGVAVMGIIAVGVASIHTVQAVSFGTAGIGLVCGARWWFSTRTTAWLTIPTMAIVSTIHWFVGDHTLVGDTVGRGLSNEILIICVAIGGLGAGTWITAGREIQ